MEPFLIHPGPTVVEAWSGYRVQFDGMERHTWQKDFKAQLKRALSGLSLSPDHPFSGFYDTTDTRVSDTENSLFTNLLAAMPSHVRRLRFEQGVAAPPPPPVPIELVSGHLHYYRYTVGDHWLNWSRNQTPAQWQRIPRHLPSDGSARPYWYALRDANANRLHSQPGHP